ncbi:NAD(P)/FAD-dependent oxidoreductase [Phycicoccus endophyticus]|uniref:NAD(P)/FAD-dependent oxidoreductase n=1 Tax=Phycicoccus endophyticus TaxID=1690220 RepID=A0A7G9R295_9MICO|nr:FAD-dependent oxidoreductase [Phycicoccus endophyticus]NHI19618.1 NAD(P)/FAD-dependent oxidoreductase [Phycicoccus endophyticus]QNN49720.1 NAD(P)/FAD-dependent oxidoreductase [Phycicoccus endophyticus]GGL34479.1 oxidoreductase [Phycicoccus endophyticus]
MQNVGSVVIGAGQAGLSTSFHLARLGVEHVVLDANPTPGGAWQHRWDSLTMRDVHGVAALPGSAPPTTSSQRANLAVPRYFADYETEHRLPVLRPVPVDRVRDLGDGSLAVEAVAADGRAWRTPTLVNATGTWTHPFVPSYPGTATFAGRQLHTHDYPGPASFAGERVVVVGGGTSAIQLLAEIAPVAADTLWVTRREPRWVTDELTPQRGRAAVALVEERVRQGRPPASVVSVTGLRLRAQEQAAARLGAYERRPMFNRVTPGGVLLPDGTRWPADTILWATGFRPALRHLAALGLRTREGGIELDGTTAVADPRVQLVGYGPSASTIGANRAGRAAALAVRDLLRADRGGDPQGRR